MNNDPALLLYTKDMLTEMANLTMEERGMFSTLIYLQHQLGSLSQKVITIQCGSNLSQDLMNKFVKNEEGNFHNEMVSGWIKKRSAHSNKQRENVMKRWSKDTKLIPTKYQKDTHELPLGNGNGNGIEEVIEEAIEVEIYPTFEDFWNIYDKKVGDKKKLEIKWSKYTQEIKETIINYLPEYIISTPEKQYRVNPQTFLNQERWENEIIKSNNNGRVKNTQKGISDHFAEKIARGFQSTKNEA
tara:strand:- start:193 stop:921 length:729 start_codon:yes stop_codon:yes gene_type:complete